MKYTINFIIFFIFFFQFGYAQTKKDGSPDMRYKSNKVLYGNSYQTPQTNSSDVRYQNGYIKQNGTYVEPHFKTYNNKTNIDNLSTTPNVNLYIGKKGSRAQDYSTEALNYGKGQLFEVGPKGGQFYTNKKGNKIYLPKRL